MNGKNRGGNILGEGDAGSTDDSYEKTPQSASTEEDQRTKPYRIAFVSSYPPRECGIATFTEDLVNHLDQLKIFQSSTVVAVNEPARVYDYGPEVEVEIEQEKIRTYEEAADYINNSGIALSCLQHEFGLFGGSWGEHILHYLDHLEVPSIVTLHTVLRNPKEKTYEVISRINEMNTRMVVMTRRSRRTLIEDYGIPAYKLRIIPHGVPKAQLGENREVKRSLRLDERFILSTFGLIHRGKGIEYVIRALPKILKKEPSVLYLVLGETHPQVRKWEGESYRNEMIDLVEDLGLEDHVRFHNRYLMRSELSRYLQATDIYLSPT